MDNQDALARLTQRETRKLDLGEMSKKYAGLTVDVWVNAPHVLEHWFGGREATETERTDSEGKLIRETVYAPMDGADERERTCKVVSALCGWDYEKVDGLEDGMLNWLFNQAWRLRREYLDELKNA